MEDVSHKKITPLGENECKKSKTKCSVNIMQLNLI